MSESEKRDATVPFDGRKAVSAQIDKIRDEFEEAGQGMLLYELIGPDLEFRLGNHELPSLDENLNIRLFTNKRNWTGPQRRMMGKAGRVHGIRVTVVAEGNIYECITSAGPRQAENWATRTDLAAKPPPASYGSSG